MESNASEDTALYFLCKKTLNKTMKANKDNEPSNNSLT